MAELKCWRGNEAGVTSAAWWRSGYGARLATPQVRLPASPRFQITTLGKLFTRTCASVAKQYDLVPVKGQ